MTGPSLNTPLQESKQGRRAVGYLPLYEREGVLIAEGSARAAPSDAYREIIEEPIPNAVYSALLVHYSDGSIEVVSTPYEEIEREVAEANYWDDFNRKALWSDSFK